MKKETIETINGIEEATMKELREKAELFECTIEQILEEEDGRGYHIEKSEDGYVTLYTRKNWNACKKFGESFAYGFEPYAETKNSLETLPTETQSKVKEVLTVYDKAYVSYEDGAYHVSPNCCIKASYSSDHKSIGTFLKDDVFTKEEQIINYVEQFHAYPISYKGKQDYQFLDSLKWDSKVKFDSNGNIVLA